MKRWTLIAILSVAPIPPVAARYRSEVWDSLWRIPASWSNPRSPGPPIGTLITPANSISTTSTASPISSVSITPDNSTDTNTNTIPSPSIHNVTVPPTCFQPHGIPLGWLPSTANITLIQHLAAPNTTPCTYGSYAHITSPTSYDFPSALSSALAASAAGAILTLSLQPFIPFSHINASQIATDMHAILALQSQAHGPGPNVLWLRFAHEMNWYIDSEKKHTGPTKYHGTPTEFKALWRDIASLVDRDRVKMFWSPNIQVPPGTLASIGEDWWPGPEFVDIVGLDVYPQARESFAFYFGAFYDMYAAPYGLPMHLGETGWLAGGSDEEKAFWLGELLSEEARSRCPGYLGFTWFEYDKPSDGGDFRVVTGGRNIAGEVLGGLGTREIAE